MNTSGCLIDSASPLIRQVQDYTNTWRNKDVAKHALTDGSIEEEIKMMETLEQQFNMINVVKILKKRNTLLSKFDLSWLWGEKSTL